jgi:Ca2+/Na+ antiporter
MIKLLTREVTLAIQAKHGASPAVVIWLGVVVVALLAAFAFICVAGYDWLALRYDSVAAGLIMAGIFLAVAVVAAIVSTITRRRVRERAILARAAKSHSASWLLDPRVLSAAVRTGRSLGWQRLVPIALVGLMVAQWAREHHNENEPHS